MWSYSAVLSFLLFLQVKYDLMKRSYIYYIGLKKRQCYFSSVAVCLLIDNNVYYGLHRVTV